MVRSSEWLCSGLTKVELQELASITGASPPNSREHEEAQKADWLFEICRREDVDVRSLVKSSPKLRDPTSPIFGGRNRIFGKIFGTPSSPSAAHVSSPAAADIPAAGLKATTTTSSRMSTAVGDVGSSPCGGFEIFPELSKALVLFTGKKHREYKVVDGDSLEWLAEKFGTSVKSIKMLNDMSDDVIYSGSILKIERSVASERQRFLGRKASAQERAAFEVGYRFLDSSIRPLMRVSASAQNSRAFVPKTVNVQYGDTLAEIACAHGLSVSELQDLNHLRDDLIFEGDVLALDSAPSKPEVVELRSGYRRTNRPLFSRQIGNALGVGATGPPLRRETPNVEIDRAERGWKSKRRGLKLQGKWTRFKSPLTAGYVSSHFGWRWGAFHQGVDFAADQGTSILASDKGVVTFAGWGGRYGYLVDIQHDGGFVTRYAHCCAIHTRVGQQVSQGQPIAAVGATGHATGPHLHFEVRKNGEALDPIQWVKL